MFEIIKKELSEIDVQVNESFNETYDFELKHKNRLVGHIWKIEENSEVLGFWGYMGPSFGKVPTQQPYSELVCKTFQIYISNTEYWYSPPSQNVLGYICKPLTDLQLLKIDLLFFTKSNFDIELINKNYRTTKHYQINKDLFT